MLTHRTPKDPTMTPPDRSRGPPYVPVPNTEEVDGLSVCALGASISRGGGGSWLAGSGGAWLCCWVGWTKAVAWVWVCWEPSTGPPRAGPPRAGPPREACTLGLVERTEPLALPYTVTCSTGGPSLACMAGGGQMVRDQ